MAAHRWSKVVPLVALAVAASGCGATSGASGGAHGGGAKAAITRNFETFFNGKNGYDTKMSLLQNSYLFRHVVRAQYKYLLAREAHVTVLHVGPVHGKSASVRFTLYEGKKVALKNQSASAVLVAGTWKVSAKTVCTLLGIEGYIGPNNSRAVYGCPASSGTGTTL